MTLGRDEWAATRCCQWTNEGAECSFPSNSLPTINLINPLVPVLIVMSDNLNVRLGMGVLFALPLNYYHVMKLVPWHFYIDFGLRFIPRFSSFM
jgi:hypothetical protein